MGRVTQLGFNDTAGVDERELSLPGINFSEDFLPVVDSPNELVLTNVTRSVSAPETARFAIKAIRDVYAGGIGSEIDPSARLDVRSGISILVEGRYIVTKTDDDDPSYYKLYPVKVGHTILVPNDGDLTDDDLLTMVTRSFGLLFDPNREDDGACIGSLRRGIMKKRVPTS